MGLVLGAMGIALAVACLGAFLTWRWRLLAQVLRGSEMAETARGPVEFARIGTGPVILQLHGGATGYDQTLALSWDVHEAGFTVLTPSRPGYLRTPLTTGATPEQAADAVASLLDVRRVAGRRRCSSRCVIPHACGHWCCNLPLRKHSSSRAAPHTHSLAGSSSRDLGNGWWISGRGACICSRAIGRPC